MLNYKNVLAFKLAYFFILFFCNGRECSRGHSRGPAFSRKTQQRIFSRTPSRNTKLYTKNLQIAKINDNLLNQFFEKIT